MLGKGTSFYRIFAFMFICGVLIFSVAGLNGCETDPSGRDKIVLNEVTHSIFYAPQYLAMALGYFEEEGIDIELVNGGGADKSMIALLTGEADIGLMGPEAAIYTVIEGKKDHPVVFGQLTKRDGSFLVAREAEEDFDWRGLNGKRILMGRQGGVPAMTLQYILNKHGYFDGVNVTMDYSVEFNMLAPAFSAGTGDYVPLFEPAASTLVKSGVGGIVASIGQESGEVPYTAYMAIKSKITDNPDLYERFLKAVNRATAYLLEHSPSECSELLLPYFNGSSLEDVEIALRAYVDNDTWVIKPSMTEESFNRLLDIMENAGKLEKRVAFESVVDNFIADKIA